MRKMKQPVRLMFTVQEVAQEFGTTEAVIEKGISVGAVFVSMVRNRRLISRSEIDHLWRELARRQLI